MSRVQFGGGVGFYLSGEEWRHCKRLDFTLPHTFIAYKLPIFARTFARDYCIMMIEILQVRLEYAILNSGSHDARTEFAADTAALAQQCTECDNLKKKIFYTSTLEHKRQNKCQQCPAPTVVDPRNKGICVNCPAVSFIVRIHICMSDTICDITTIWLNPFKSPWDYFCESVLRYLASWTCLLV